jgi:Trypsin-like peptidase domain
VTDSSVLTAYHVIEDAASIVVRFGAGRSGWWEATVVDRWCDRESELAVLTIEPPPSHPPLPRTRYGRLRHGEAVDVPVHIAGFPRLKLRREATGGAGAGWFRELRHASGRVALMSNARTECLEISLDTRPEDDGSHSPWEGMSGAAVWVNDRVVGVVFAHYWREGVSVLTATTIEKALAGADANRSQLPSLLGIPPADIADVTPWTWGATVRAAQANQVSELLPSGGLEDRAAELDELARFCWGDEAYVWWQGEPWAGKAALLSTFAIEPPPDVHVVSFFVSRTRGQKRQRVVHRFARGSASCAARRTRPTSGASAAGRAPVCLADEGWATGWRGWTTPGARRRRPRRRH